LLAWLRGLRSSAKQSIASTNQIHGSDPVQCRISLYRFYEKQRRSVSNSYAVVSTLAARKQKSLRKNNKERLR
jgi:hypothetical protein